MKARVDQSDDGAAYPGGQRRLLVIGFALCSVLAIPAAGCMPTPPAPSGQEASSGTEGATSESETKPHCHGTRLLRKKCR